MTPVRLLACLLLLTTATAVSAATFVVDDSASTVESHAVRMKWDQVAPGHGSSQVTGRLTVQARLDVSPWQGRSGRIYLTLPISAATPVTANWTSRGRLLPGTLRPGERALVYAGPISSAVLEDTLELSLHADGRDLLRSEQLRFVFEIDVESL